ncbi:hypothetical protein HPB47_017615 [Ixodes persulcatus]|uniref:Uncharacterized protein n=1 Tax=Ixodes persulcatus TaxID=34615 RepID=A0AC60QMW4_IXOPE|nr:hypothetical protein HPB47_017615 [Ixodes persulcatus]
MRGRRDHTRQTRESVCYGLWMTVSSTVAIAGTLFSAQRSCLVPISLVLELVAGVWLRWTRRAESTAGPLTATHAKGPSPLVRAVGLLAASVLFFHILAVLFGAPLLEEVEETLCFGVHMTVLTVLPLVLCAGRTTVAALHKTLLDHRGCESRLESLQRLGALGALAGAWLGCVTLPLDWDRPWQRWPIPCLLGASLARTGTLMVACFLGSSRVLP